MQIRTFKAPTINEALQLVKKELGPDAVILKNERVTVSPTHSYVEIMAAVDPEPHDPPSAPESDPSSFQVHDEIKEIKSMLSMLISSKDYFTQLQLQQPLAEIYHSLLMRGLDEKHTFLLLKKAVSDAKEEPFRKQELVAAFCQQLLSRVRFTNPFRGDSLARAKCLTFLGPTGVGKTTTLAKLAAHLKIKRHLDVALISLDTYRIGAVDQLQHYAEILNIPMAVAQTVDELARAREQFRHYDVLLIDTIGKNFLQRKHVQDLMSIMNGAKGIQHLLVLSATAKDEDLRQTIRHFNAVKIQSLIFTKLDETLSPGSMFNQLLRFSHPVSYLGIGQCVPEDIRLASHKNLLAFLFPSGRAVKEDREHVS